MIENKKITQRTNQKESLWCLWFHIKYYYLRINIFPKDKVNKVRKTELGKRHVSLTNVGRLEGFPDRSSGRYSAITLVTTRARRYSATPLLSTAWSLCSKRLITDSGLPTIYKLAKWISNY